MKVLDIDKIKNSLYEKVEDFGNRISPVYKSLDWKWGLMPDLAVPTADDIKAYLMDLIDDITEVDLTGDCPKQHLRTGGLSVGYTVIIEKGVISFITIDMTFEVSADYEYDSYEIRNFMKDKV